MYQSFCCEPWSWPDTGCALSLCWDWDPWDWAPSLTILLQAFLLFPSHRPLWFQQQSLGCDSITLASGCPQTWRAQSSLKSEIWEIQWDIVSQNLISILVSTLSICPFELNRYICDASSCCSNQEIREGMEQAILPLLAWMIVDHSCWVLKSVYPRANDHAKTQERRFSFLPPFWYRCFLAPLLFRFLLFSAKDKTRCCIPSFCWKCRICTFWTQISKLNLTL